MGTTSRAAVVLLCLTCCFSQLLGHPLLHKTSEDKCGYQSCPILDPGKLNVHMVPHSHDDVGWLKTVDQYYYGVNPEIQRAGVQYILDSVVQELLQDSSKRFVYVETAFLWKWWQDRGDKYREEIRGLINSGQLEILGGAWSMNDEAVTHYQSIIDQFTWGLRTLNDTFGECARPRVGWQIDPFGHSREMASLFAQMGFDGLFFGRLDFQDKVKRLTDKTAEMVWQGSPDNIGAAADLFTHALYNHYSPPPGFCFDLLCNNAPMVDNENSPEYNIPQRIESFLAFIHKQAKSFNTKNIILTMGEDFHYQDANMWFSNLDKVIKHVNARQANGSLVNVFYSTPSCYLKAVNEAGAVWPTKRDDFFPYASDPQSYWTGYYTSKPTIKYFERLGNNFLQVCKQAATLAGIGGDEGGLTALREAMGVMQHHDAITGTMKSHVAHDYARLLSDALDRCGNTVQTAVNKLMMNGDQTLIPVISCLKLNISECAMSEQSERFVVTVWNPLSRPMSHHVRLPVPKTADYLIHDSNHEATPSELMPIHTSVLNVPGRESAAFHDLLFQARDVPPLGYRSYHIERSDTYKITPPTRVSRDNTISNEQVTLLLDERGLTKSLHMNGVEISIQQSFRFYNVSQVVVGRASGAYVFRPDGIDTVNIPITSFQIHKGALVEEVHQVFGSGWVSQVIRLYKDDNHVEFEWLVGPIPDHGAEVISHFQTNLESDSTFYTDSNGRELLKRVRNFRPTWQLNSSEPISSNYYPVTSKILLRDEAAQREVAVLVDRAQGGSSLCDGQLELMVHRRLLHDDGFGVGESLTEMAYNQGLVVRGLHYLVAGPLAGPSPTLAVGERLLAQAKLLGPWMLLSPTELSHSDWGNLYTMELRSIFKEALPNYVQILTLEPWKENSILLRLENILEKTDDPSVSTTATVDLQELFSSYSQIVIDGVRETTLAGNQWLYEAERLVWFSESSTSVNTTPWKELDVAAVTLSPMQIRTFVIQVASGKQ